MKKSRLYLERLEKLNAWVIQKFQNIPRSRRKALSMHQAFAYYGKAYHFEFLSLVGISTSELSACCLAKTIQKLKTLDVTSSFLEPVQNDNHILALQKETGIQIKGKLYSDFLSSSHGPAPTYEQMIRFNTQTLVDAFSE